MASFHCTHSIHSLTLTHRYVVYFEQTWHNGISSHFTHIGFSLCLSSPLDFVEGSIFPVQCNKICVFEKCSGWRVWVICMCYGYAIGSKIVCCIYCNIGCGRSLVFLFHCAHFLAIFSSFQFVLCVVVYRICRLMGEIGNILHIASFKECYFDNVLNFFEYAIRLPRKIEREWKTEKEGRGERESPFR